MAKKKTPVLSVDYEGMGTCIAADLKIDGKRVCTVTAASPENNDQTDKFIDQLLWIWSQKE